MSDPVVRLRAVGGARSGVLGGPVGAAVRRWSAVLSLLAYQVVPLPLAPENDTSGRVEFGLGGGGDGYLQERFGCNGEVLASRPVTSYTVSAIVEYFAPRSTTVLTAFGGTTHASSGACTIARSGTSCGLAEAYDGAFAGVLVGTNRRRVGVAVGGLMLPDLHRSDGPVSVAMGSRRALRPSGSLRLGRESGPHLLLDVLRVRAPGEGVMSSLGVELLGRRAGGTQLLLGVGLLPYFDVGESGAYAAVGRLQQAVGAHVDLNLGGYVGAGDLFGLNAGARLRLGGSRGPPPP